MDFTTILIWNGILYGLLSVILFVFYLVFRSRTVSLMWWAAGYSLHGIGSLLVAFRHSLAPFISVVVANVLLLAGMPAMVIGLRTMRGKRSGWPWAAAFLGLVAAWQTWFLYGYESTTIRAALYSIAAVTQAWLVHMELSRQRSSDRHGTPNRLASVFTTLLTAAYAFRFLLIVRFGLPTDLLSASTWEPLIQSAYAVLMSGLALTLPFLITSRIASELEDALEERGIIIREMTHRIKNDLTLVDSLISLQSTQIRDPEVVAELDTLRLRIGGIAAAHDQLARKNDSFDETRVLPYFEVILGSLPVGPHVTVEGDFEDLSLPNKLALNLGMALNELATNALKYAFPGRERGTLRLRFRGENGTGILVVSDDGIGTTWPPKKRGVGSMIIDAMVASLGGTLEYTGGEGSTFRLSFPIPDKRNADNPG